MAHVLEGGPADEAGLQGIRAERVRERRASGIVVEYARYNRDDADKIISINGNEIRSTDDYQSALDGSSLTTLSMWSANELDVDEP